MLVPSEISKAYCPVGMSEDGVHRKLSPIAPEVMVVTVSRLSEGPLLRVRVTGPSASSQVISKGSPASIPSKSLLVMMTWALARAAKKRAAMEDFIMSIVLIAVELGERELRRAIRPTWVLV
jgi:hypothetical protein